MPSINIDLDFFTHRKATRLTKILGPASTGNLIRLWCHVGKHYPDAGGATDWLADEVEDAAAWMGEKGAFVECLMRLNLLHRWEDGFRIHDWKEHAGHLRRYREKARKAVNARWRKRMPGSPDACGDAPGSAPGILQAILNDDPGNTNAVQCNTETTSGGDKNPACEAVPGAARIPRTSAASKVVWDGTDFSIPDALFGKWRAAYPGVNVSAEARKAAAWLMANPQKAKKNHARFLNGWMSRARPEAADDGYSLDPELEAWAEEAVARGEI